MIARVAAIAAIVCALAPAAAAQDQTGPFDVSLSGAHVINLSSVYEQVIREATDAYRGDFPNYTVTEFTTVVAVRRRFRFLKQWIDAPPELQEGFDPFPQVPFTLGGKPEEVTPHR
jgi:hypothetical protein